MSSLTSLVTATIAALALGGSAWAAVPAAGEEPEFNTLSSSSEFTRAEVEAKAAQEPPAAGQASDEGPAATSGSELTRAEVEDEVRAEEAQGHAFPDASGDQRVQ